MRLFWHELKGELLLYVRSRELAFFTFLFPLLIFVLLGSVYGDDTIKKEHGVKASAYLLAGILGYGVVSTAFAGLQAHFHVALLRELDRVADEIGDDLPQADWIANESARDIRRDRAKQPQPFALGAGLHRLQQLRD